MIHLQCTCGKRLRLSEALAGEDFSCPGCKHPFRVAGSKSGSTDLEAPSRLIIVTGPEHRKHEQLFLTDGQKLGIGRKGDNSIILVDDKVSRYHCALESMPKHGWKVVDLGSRNGIGVNGKRISEHVLEHGDVLRVGHHELRFLVDATTPIPANAFQPGQQGFGSNDTFNPFANDGRDAIMAPTEMDSMPTGLEGLVSTSLDARPGLSKRAMTDMPNASNEPSKSPAKAKGSNPRKKGKAIPLDDDGDDKLAMPKDI